MCRGHTTRDEQDEEHGNRSSAHDPGLLRQQRGPRRAEHARTAGIVGGATFTSRLILWTGRPTALPVGGLLLAGCSLLGMALLPPDKRTLVALGFTTGLGLGSVMSVMQIVTQTASGPARLGAAAATMSLARTLGSSIGASAFGALIFGLMGSSDALHAAQDPHAQEALRFAFVVAFGCAAAVCALAAWAASRVPALRFHPGPEGRTDFSE
jgi:MFS family permease